jgi:hypothetical protein
MRRGSGCDDMNDAVSETTQPGDSPPRFQFALWQLLTGSICVGAGVVYSPIGTLLFLLATGMIAASLYIKFRSFLVVSALWLLLAVVLIPMLSPRGRRSRVRVAKYQLDAIAMALEKYRDDFREYPPDNFNLSNGSELLHHYLCRGVQIGQMHYGPYLENIQTSDLDGNGILELNTTWGHRYIYILRSDGKAQVINPGKDGLPGGTINSEKGFVPDGSDANRDGDPDDKDNLYSIPVVPAGGGL